MALAPAHVECLLMALLSVNSFSLEKAWTLLPRMRDAGLTDPARVATMEMSTVIEALTGAGYDRKNLTWLFAERVKALMVAIRDGQLDGLDEAISRKDKKAATALLTPIRGIGPRVVENAWALLMG